MANPPRDVIADDFLEQIMAYGDPQVSCGGGGQGESGFLGEVFPLGPTSEENGGGCGKVVEEDVRDRSASAKVVSGAMQPSGKELTSVFPLIGHVQDQHVHANPSPQGLQPFHGQPTPVTTIAPQQTPAPRPRVRARRGQATDPHSIAERLRRERIAERIRAIQDLVPTVNKTDRAAMLDEIVDYVKFLKLQVKVLSMSRLGGAGAVDPLVTDVPLPSIQVHATEGASSQQIWDKWSTDDVEQQVAKLMEEDIGAAMQFLRSKALCIMPISFAATIFHGSQQPEAPSPVKPEPNSPL